MFPVQACGIADLQVVSSVQEDGLKHIVSIIAVDLGPSRWRACASKRLISVCR
jgi:hypothetical protein